MDLFKQPIATLTYNGKSVRKTSLGGLFTLVTFFLLCLGIQVKISSELSMAQSNERGGDKLVDPATGKRLLQSKGDVKFTNKNLRIFETKQVEIGKMNYTDFIRPFDKNLNKVSIIFNDNGHREQIEEAMYLQNDPRIRDKSHIR